VQLGVVVSVAGTLLFGTLPAATELLASRAQQGTMLQRYQSPATEETAAEELAEAP
jgi:hypothetical protein